MGRNDIASSLTGEPSRTIPAVNGKLLAGEPLPTSRGCFVRELEEPRQRLLARGAVADDFEVVQKGPRHPGAAAHTQSGGR